MSKEHWSEDGLDLFKTPENLKDYNISVLNCSDKETPDVKFSEEIIWKMTFRSLNSRNNRKL